MDDDDGSGGGARDDCKRAGAAWAEIADDKPPLPPSLLSAAEVEEAPWAEG